MSKEYVIYCDESDVNGRYFSNFYGGALVTSSELQNVTNKLIETKQLLNLHKEVKWTKITENYVDKYISLMETYFNLIAENKIKIRIMFTQNSIIPYNLDKEQIDNEYFLLYYQFIKNAFGLQYSNDSNPPSEIRVRICLDALPDTREKGTKFKNFLLGLNENTNFKEANIYIDKNQISEVNSHDHPILQCLDIILGSMQFRLNDKHKEKPEGAKTRGKRTIAKEKVYKYINSRIRQIYPNFNIGVSTSIRGDVTNRWFDPYRHWVFVPQEHTFDSSLTKTSAKK